MTVPQQLILRCPSISLKMSLFFGIDKDVPLAYLTSVYGSAKTGATTKIHCIAMNIIC